MDKKSFWQVELTLPKEKAAAVEEFFLKSGAVGFHELLYREGETDNLNTDSTMQVYHFQESFPVKPFMIFALEVLGGPSWTYKIEQTGQEDYLKSMKEFFQTEVVFPGLVLAPPWETNRLPAQEESKTLIIKPSFAFGTGKHETTILMLEFIRDHVRSGDFVLDLGCGSGILALAALLFGAERVLGVDVETLSVESALDNYRLNLEWYQAQQKTKQEEGKEVDSNSVSSDSPGSSCNWEEKTVEFETGDFSIADERLGEIDLFLSNILPEIFYQNESKLEKLLKNSHRWALSGIYGEQAERFEPWLCERLSPEVAQKIGITQKDGWYCFFYSGN